MSLFSALNNAVSSIDAINTAVRTVSDNVSNANNPNYNRREEQFESRTIGGVRIADIERATNAGLQRDLFDQQTDAEASGVRDRLLGEIQQLTGTINSETPLADALERFRTAWKAFEAAPESDAAESDIILSGRDIVSEMGRLSDGLDLIEQQILTDIDDTVTRLNDSLAEVDRLNSDIVRDKASGRSVSALENLRDAELEKIAGVMDIRTFERSDGSISVYTKTGLDLTDRQASTFTWDPSDRTLTKTGSPSTDLITGGQLPDGELKALIDFVRNDQAAVDSNELGIGQVQKLRNQLDELAHALTDDATRATTSTATMSASDSLTSLSGVDPGDDFTIDVGAGAVTVPSGGGPLGAAIDATDTVQDLVDELNTIANVRARLTAHGTLEIATVSGTDLTLADTTGTALAGLGLISGASQTFAARDPATFASAYNNATAGAGDAANFFEAESGTTPDAVTRNNIRVNDTLTNGTESLKDLSGNAVVESLNGQNRSLVGSGSNLTGEDYTGLASGILTEVVTRAERADTLATQNTTLRDDLRQSLRDEVGVDIGQEMTRLTVLQNSYSATARVINSVDQMFQALEQAVR